MANSCLRYISVGSHHLSWVACDNRDPEASSFDSFEAFDCLQLAEGRLPSAIFDPHSAFARLSLELDVKLDVS